MLLKTVRSVFSARLTVSPGQIDVLKTGVKRGIPLLLLPRYTCAWDHVVFSLVLWLHGMKTPVVHMHSDMGPYSKVVSLCLRRLGVVRSIGLSDLLRSGESVQTWLSVSDHILLDTLVLSQEQGGVGDILAVPVLATYEQGKGWWC